MPRPSVLPVYVIHWQAPDRCVRTVRSLVASGGLSARVHIVDNSPGLLEPVRPELDGLGATILENDDNLGFAGGANRALTHCVSHYPEAIQCLIVAHDVLVDEGSLAALVSATAADPHIAVAGPRFGPGGEVVGGTWNGRRGRWRKQRWPGGRSSLDVDWLLGACLLVDTAWVLDHGGFDARLGSYVEDVDFCLRVRDTGRRVVCVRDALATEDGRSSGDVTRVVDRNTMYVAYKRSGPAGLAATMALTLWLALKTALASLLPRRDAGQRSTSRARTRAHLAAVVDVARDRTALAAFRRVADAAANPIRADVEPSRPPAS